MFNQNKTIYNSIVENRVLFIPFWYIHIENNDNNFIDFQLIHDSSDINNKLERWE